MACRWLVIPIVCLAACNDDNADEIQTPKLCSEAAAKIAVSKVMVLIMQRIADPRTRAAGCEELDDVLRSYNQAFDAYKPADCEWAVGRDEPEQILRNFGNAHSSSLARLCKWQDNDAGRRGREILDSLSPEDRQTIEDAYNGF